MVFGAKGDVFDLALGSVLEYRGPPQTAEAQDWRAEIVHLLEDRRASMLRHPWSASLLPRRALGPNMLGRLELLSQTLSRAGVADADVNAAIWSLWNYVMGATITFDLSDDDRAAAHQRLTRLSQRYPTVERSRLLLDNDWDSAFRKGLDFLLDGLAPSGLLLPLARSTRDLLNAGRVGAALKSPTLWAGSFNCPWLQAAPISLQDRA